MSAPVLTASPISNSQEWHRFRLKGVLSPGTIPKGGIKGFKRATGWDIKKGKGSQGATLTLDEVPPVTGSITLQLFTDDDFIDWFDFVSDVLFTDAALQKSEGLTIFHPAFGAIALTTVVVKSFSAPEHQGKGVYHVTIELLEWSSPPPTSVVSTPDSTAPDESDGDAPKPQDPRIASRQAQIALLNRKAGRS